MHFIVKVLHCLPEPYNDIVVGGVAIGIHCVLTPVINTDLRQSTEEILEGERGGERERGRERERERDVLR